jgi:hypothetical protein
MGTTPSIARMQAVDDVGVDVVQEIRFACQMHICDRNICDPIIYTVECLFVVAWA